MPNIRYSIGRDIGSGTVKKWTELLASGFADEAIELCRRMNLGRASYNRVFVKRIETFEEIIYPVDSH